MLENVIQGLLQYVLLTKRILFASIMYFIHLLVAVELSFLLCFLIFKTPATLFPIMAVPSIQCL